MTSEKRPFELDDLYRFEFIGEAALSPDGKYAVYSALKIDAEKEEEYSTLWFLDMKTVETRPLTFTKGRDFFPQWSPDGKRVAFLSTRSGAPQIYVLPARGGEAVQLTHMKQGVGSAPIWSPNGRKIVFTAGPAEPIDLAKPYRLKRNVYRFDGFGYIDPGLQNLYVIDASGGEPKRLTQDDFHASLPCWSPDGSEILYSAGFDPDSYFFPPSLRVVNLDGESRQALDKEWGMVSNATWLADGRIAFAGTPAGKKYGSKYDLWVMDREGKSIECRTSELENGIGGLLHDDMPSPWMFSPTPILAEKDCLDVVAPVQVGGTVHAYRIALNGAESCKPLTEGERTCFPLSRAGGRLLFGISDLFEPSQLGTVDLDGKNERTLTRLNADLLCQLQMPEVQHLEFHGSDGQAVEGWFLKPTGVKLPLPTVLHIHGGPHAGYGRIFHFDFLTLAGAGFGVLFVNHRGSTGYGDAFATAIHGDWGNLDYHDLMAGVDHAIGLGLADPDRLGCCGVSGGGNLTCWIVGNTRRFKAAVPENPVTNWVSFYGVSDIGPFFSERELGGKPHEIPEVYRRCSPITYAHTCTTPTLLVQGEADYRCPAEQSEQFYTVLKANGCVAEMLRFPASSHNGASTGTPAVRKAHNQALLEWMQRYLTP